MQIIYPSQDLIHDPGQPWDGAFVMNLVVSDVPALDCQSVMAVVDRTGAVSHPVSCSFTQLTSGSGGTVYFMDPNTLAYTGSIGVQEYYAPWIPEEVIFDVFVSIVVLNWILDFVLFFSYLRKKFRKIAKR